MTEQITVPKQTWDAVVEALKKPAYTHALALQNISEALELVMRWIDDYCDTGPETGFEAIESKVNEALTAANALQPQAQGEQSYWAEVIGMFVDRLNHGPQTVSATDVLSLLNDCQYLASLTQPQATEPAGWKLAPVIPTEEQWGGLARDIMMWLDMDGRKTAGSLFKHLERCGTSIPQWLRDEPEMKNLDHVPSKGTRVTIIYRAMLAAAPEAP